MATPADLHRRPRLLIWVLVAGSIGAAMIGLYLGWLRAGTYNDECVASAQNKRLLQTMWILDSSAVTLNTAALVGLYVWGGASARGCATAVVTWALLVTAAAAGIVGSSLCFTLPIPS